MAQYEKLPDCCPPGAEPLLAMADYQPKGEMVTMGTLNCYVTWPAGAKRAVIIFQDIFGIHTGRHKQICDMLAEKGYGAVAPDFTGKDPIIANPPKYGMSLGCCCSFLCAQLNGSAARKAAALSWEPTMSALVLDTIVPWMKDKGASKFASVGFCWGTYGSMSCGKYPNLFSCNASFHPSTESFCKHTKEDDLVLCRSIKAPQLVVATSMESAKWKAGGAAQQAVEEDGTLTLWKDEPKQKHGFMTRGDTKNEETRDAVKGWMKTMFDFFETHMN